jgi:hyperosmotically inducible periplasmic protein
VAELQADDVLKGAEIDAVVRKGDVRLIGVVPNASHRSRAETISRAVRGVHTIHNELTLPAA